MRELTSWEHRHLKKAEQAAEESKDPSTKVGAIIVDHRNGRVSQGYNGFPIGVEDTPERLNNRELKYKMVVHAETNAFAFAKRDVEGCSIYTWPFMPCSVCAGSIIQFGIKKVVAPYSDLERWQESFRITEMMFREAGVELLLRDYPKIEQLPEVKITPPTVKYWPDK